MSPFSDASGRSRRTLLWVIVAALIFLALDLFLFPRRLPREITLEPRQVWTLGDTPSGLAPDSLFLRLGDWEAAWSASAGLGRVRALKAQEAVSDHAIAWRDLSKNQIVVEAVDGSSYTIPSVAYPFWVKGRLFTLDDSRMTLSAWGDHGAALWTKSFASLVTAVDASKGLAVVGTLDGRVEVFDNKGAVGGEFQPGGSRLPVVYNVSLSTDGRRILVLAGLDPKRFLILDRGGSDFRPVFHKPLRENHPWPTPLGFLSGGHLAYFEKAGALGMVNPSHPDQEVDVALSGELGDVVGEANSRLVYFVDAAASGSELRLASTNGTSVLRFPFQGRESFLRLQKNHLLLGLDQTIVLFDVRFQ